MVDVKSRATDMWALFEAIDQCEPDVEKQVLTSLQHNIWVRSVLWQIIKLYGNRMHKNAMPDILENIRKKKTP
ncbi:MAG: hypothetical protein V8S14_03215 [Lachnospiraceae bacterium]